MNNITSIFYTNKSPDYKSYTELYLSKKYSANTNLVEQNIFSSITSRYELLIKYDLTNTNNITLNKNASNSNYIDISSINSSYSSNNNYTPSYNNACYYFQIIYQKEITTDGTDNPIEPYNAVTMMNYSIINYDASIICDIYMNQLITGSMNNNVYNLDEKVPLILYISQDQYYNNNIFVYSNTIIEYEYITESL